MKVIPLNKNSVLYIIRVKILTLSNNINYPGCAYKKINVLRYDF